MLTWLLISIAGKQYANLTETGKLMLLGFKEQMSGSYMCTLSYRVFRNDMQAEEERFKTYKFMVYGKRKKLCPYSALF